MVHGPSAGLDLLNALDADGRLARPSSPRCRAAHLLEMAGNPGAAIAHYLTAADRTASLPERNYLMTQAARLRRAERAELGRCIRLPDTVTYRRLRQHSSIRDTPARIRAQPRKRVAVGLRGSLSQCGAAQRLRAGRLAAGIPSYSSPDISLAILRQPHAIGCTGVMR